MNFGLVWFNLIFSSQTSVLAPYDRAFARRLSTRLQLVVSSLVQQCPLCRLDKELRVSHIVPAFAGRYLKKTSATGYLPNGLNPNIRSQDLAKQPLLCNDCEQLLGSFEREFSLKAFPLIQRDSYRELEYDLWLLKFAVSVSWRILAIMQTKVEEDVPQFKEAIQQSLENWRVFLLGKKKQPGSEHHIFVVAGVPESMPKNMHPKILHYLLRGIDATPFVSDKQVGVYAKVIRSMFYSPIVPASAPGWKNTRIHAGPGRLISAQQLGMPGFMEFIEGRVTEVHSRPISDNQRRKIADAMLRDPERTLASESFKVHEATKRLLGDAP